MRFGRLPRLFDPRIPHFSAWLNRRKLAPPPAACDYTAALPDDLGMLGNSQWGDCTCAAMLHAQQVWSANANPPMLDVTDAEALAAYEAACGFDPSKTDAHGNNPTDQGGDEQSVLTYWLNNPVANNKLAAFVEVDVRNLDDIKRVIFESAACFIGFNVPAFLQGPLQQPGATWDINPSADNSIVGGHAVILAGYDAKGATVISWGAKYVMTWPFFSAFTDEAYGLCDAEWIEASGLSPAGLSMNEIKAQMQALKVSQGWPV